jgi:hypothetical protein
MEERERILLRVAYKCQDFARQLSYCRARPNVDDTPKLYFWISVFNNFIDLAILDWLHLFGSHSDDLHWKKIAGDAVVFKGDLLDYLELDDVQWKIYWKSVKEYRDKDVAHIEVRPMGHVPDMNTALKATAYYYRYVFGELSKFATYTDLPTDLIEYYRESLEQAERIVTIAYDATKQMREQVF